MRKRLTWVFWVVFIAIVLITILLAILIFWLLKTQDFTKASSIISLIASVVAILIGPLTLLFTILKWPDTTTSKSPPAEMPPATPPPAGQPGEQPVNDKVIWTVPYHRNPFFTGREDLLKKLHDHFTQAKTTALTQPPAITGLGGIGKTQTAIEYAYRHKDEYKYVLWVNAAARETLIHDFIEIARLLGLPEKDEQDQNKAVAAVKQWFTGHNRWLLIMDNADDFSLTSEFLPAGDNGHILLTTREQAWGSVAYNLEVEKMDETEGILFLLRRAKILKSPDAPLSEVSHADQDTAAAIVREVDGLPLALDQAGAYIEETRGTLEAYLKTYKRRQKELLQERGKDRQYHPDPVAATWSLNFKQVERLNKTAADLLRFLAFLAPDAIPEEMIVAGASKLGRRLKALAIDETLLDQSMKTLNRFSLVQRDTGKRQLFIHRLVQAILRASMTEKTRREWVERTVRAINLAFPDVQDINLWPQCERQLPHALACAELINEYTLTFTEAALLLIKTGYYLKDHAQYEQAEPLYLRALDICEHVLGSNHPNTAQSLNNLAALYRDQGKYEQAEPLYQHALDIDEQALGPNHPDVATDLNNLAELYRDQGKYEQAELLQQRALAIREQVLGPNHPNTAQSLNNLAALYRDQGKYEQAEPLYQRAIAIFEKTLGPDHPNTKTGRGNYAGLLEDMQREGKQQQG
ncbi:MAG TPA: tetratricopeptide repeat protein [Ktedonobacteraceae bacterium]|nr:tetratricopeptide repeat protein [Ktedonobacteraceae bacterium]